MDSSGKCCIRLSNDDISVFGADINWRVVDAWLLRLGYPEPELDELETKGDFVLSGHTLLVKHEDSDWLEIAQWLIDNQALPVAVVDHDEYGGVRIAALGDNGSKATLEFEMQGDEDPDPQELIEAFDKWKALLLPEFIDLGMLKPVSGFVDMYRGG